MPIENPSIKDLEARLKRITVHKLDGKEYIITRDLAKLLGTTYYGIRKLKKMKAIPGPKLRLCGDYYTKQQARAIYTALYLS